MVVVAALLVIVGVPIVLFITLMTPSALGLLLSGIIIVLIIVSGLLSWRHYRQTWGDKYTSYDTTMNMAVDTIEHVLEEAGLIADRLVKADDPAIIFTIEFHVRSEGFRIGLVQHGTYASVYVGPIKDFNKKVVKKVLYLIDKYLWKPDKSSYSVFDGRDLRFR